MALRTMDSLISTIAEMRSKISLLEQKMFAYERKNSDVSPTLGKRITINGNIYFIDPDGIAYLQCANVSHYVNLCDTADNTTPRSWVAGNSDNTDPKILLGVYPLAGGMYEAVNITEALTTINNALYAGGNIKGGPVTIESVFGNTSILSGANIGGNEAVRILTYQHEITSDEATADSFDHEISVTLANVRSVSLAGLDVTASTVNPDTYGGVVSLQSVITSTTNIHVHLGSLWAAEDLISITIIEAI